MLGELSKEQIEKLLKELPVGRIGCHSDGITYIVPVNYVYDGTNLYAHSAKGMKIDMMRKILRYVSRPMLLSTCRIGKV
jgi:nitroimidazol reductase NimA-like FMN-containing flavoprotein (pyridoxamine 5'-phosphate oxidase superfamily)